MLVSILTVTLNAREHLSGLIDSIWQQYRSAESVQHEIEWVVVDGGSTDGTVQLIRANEDIVSRWVSEPDAGFYDALNKALSLASGTYYLVMGADDRFVAGAFNAMVHELRTAPDRDLYMFGVLRSNRILRPHPPTRWRKHVGWSQFVSSHSVGTVIRRSLHKKVGLYSMRYPLLADGYFLRRAIDNGGSTHIAEAVLGEFAEGGMTASTNDVRIIAETWMIQIQLGERVVPQTMLLLARVARMLVRQRARAK